MIYPTVTCKKGKVHAVWNENDCICGVRHWDQTLNNPKELYRSILFRDIDLISCRKCKLGLKRLDK
jgi:hypothetical protein